MLAQCIALAVAMSEGNPRLPGPASPTAIYKEYNDIFSALQAHARANCFTIKELL